MNKKWEILPKISDDFIGQFPEIDPIILQLLYNRGLKTQEEIDNFLYPDYSQDLYDPFLFQDMEKAVKRIIRAIEQQEKIMIYGDYDADGVTSTTVLISALKKLGVKNIDSYIPDSNREEYGLNQTAIEQIIRDGYKLIITCDCGSSNKKEVEVANKSGVDVIITDHHLMPQNPQEIPPAYAIINPCFDKNYPFKDLAGVGVAFKLVQALFRQLSNQISNLEAFEKWLLDLVAIGTVVDIKPLLNENRVLVKHGLIVLNKTFRLGLRALVNEAGLILGNLDTHHLSWQMGPRLNAARRLDKADLALGLLLTESKEEANCLAAKLNKINSERQRIVDLAFQRVKSDLEAKPDTKVVAIYGQNWPAGILGLLSQRILEEYNRVAVVMTDIRDIEIKGSGRGPGGFNLVEALSQFKEYFSSYGGHRQACGFTLKNREKVNEFINLFTKSVGEKLAGLDLTPKLFIETEIELEKVSWDLMETLETFAPFGEGNPKPLFLAKNLIIENLQWVGQNGQHLKIYVSGGKKMIGFSLNNHPSQDLRIGDKIDVVFEISENIWNGQKEIQMRMVDIRKI